MTTAGARPDAARRHCMGTVFTIDIRDAGSWEEAIAEVVDWLHSVDAVFSTYRTDSDISRLRRGRTRRRRREPRCRHVLDLCAGSRDRDRRLLQPVLDGRLDPTGLVRDGRSSRRAELLLDAGSTTMPVNGGGDIQIAVRLPRATVDGRHHRSDSTSRILTTVIGRNFASPPRAWRSAAHTSSTPHRCRPADVLVSVTVVGRTLTRVPTLMPPRRSS